MTSDQTSNQSRWGYHPCNLNLFLKLKRLHKWYWQTVYDFHRWHRWWRKEESNRRGPEPRYCATFVTNVEWYKPARTLGVDGYKVYPRTVVDLGIPAVYHQARMPADSPVEMFDREAQSRIETLYETVKAHFGG